MLYPATKHVFENFGVGAISQLTRPWLLDLLARLSASLRNKSCKRLGSRRKRSIKRWLSLLIFQLWMLIMRMPDNGRSRPVRWHDDRQLTRNCFISQSDAIMQTNLCSPDIEMLFWTLRTCANHSESFVTWRHCASRMTCDVKLSGKPYLHSSFAEP